MAKPFTESVVEEAALDMLGGLGFAVAYGPDLADSERGGDYGRVVLEGRLRRALGRLNPNVPEAGIEEAFRKLTRPDAPATVSLVFPDCGSYHR